MKLKIPDSLIKDVYLLAADLLGPYGRSGIVQSSWEGVSRIMCDYYLD